MLASAKSSTQRPQDAQSDRVPPAVRVCKRSGQHDLRLEGLAVRYAAMAGSASRQPRVLSGQRHRFRRCPVRNFPGVFNRWQAGQRRQGSADMTRDRSGASGHIASDGSLHWSADPPRPSSPQRRQQGVDTEILTNGNTSRIDPAAVAMMGKLSTGCAPGRQMMLISRLPVRTLAQDPELPFVKTLDNLATLALQMQAQHARSPTTVRLGTYQHCGWTIR